MTRAEILDKVSGTLVEMFELDPKIVTREAHLTTDLGLDSIDAIDMAARIQEFTGKRVPEDDLVRVRTVGDVADLVERMTAQPQGG